MQKNFFIVRSHLKLTYRTFMTLKLKHFSFKKLTVCNGPQTNFFINLFAKTFLW